LDNRHAEGPPDGNGGRSHDDVAAQDGIRPELECSRDGFHVQPGNIRLMTHHTPFYPVGRVLRDQAGMVLR
jgi:hypothetical protein